MIYRTTRPNPPAALQVRIRRAPGGAWLPVPLLASAGAWVKGDDGQGPLWVLLDAIHPADLITRSTFNRLKQSQN